jgi:ABC-type multidrug transport system fused ATPase/permease subunit
MINYIKNLFNIKRVMTQTTRQYNIIDIESIDSDQLNKTYQINNKAPSMINLCFNIFKNNISYKFASNMSINIVFSSLLIPSILKISNDNFIRSNNIYYGISFVISALICEIFTILQKNRYIEPLKREFVSSVHYELEDVVNRSINQINWNKLRELNKNELDQKKSMAKWSILGFISSTINTFISMFSFFGYTFWVGWISPVSLGIYILVLSLITIYYPRKQKIKREIYHEIWDRYANFQTNMYTDIIHHQGENTLNEMKHCMLTIEKNRDEDKRNNSNFTDTIAIGFNIAFVLNCIIIVNSTSIKTEITNIIVYIQYSCLMKSSIIMCISLYNQYIDSKREYEKLKDIIDDSIKKVELEQIYEFDHIIINKLEYTYPKITGSTNIPFTLRLNKNEKLIFKLGQIIRLDGNSGHGKSTFSDIINAIIPYNEYDSNIVIYQYKNHIIKNIIGFDVITESRYYNEQQESIGWKRSICEIIAGPTITEQTKEIEQMEITEQIESDVWKSIEMTMCLDFVKRYDIENELKWIHTKNVGLSGGQKGRIALARSIYRIISTKPKIVTLDEVDKAIQATLVAQIMSNIYSYARSNNILVFSICHSPDVQKLNVYDQVLSFTNGLITKTL